MKPDLLLLIITILVALIFDFLNGFHDAANSIATVVSTRVLSPKLAVAWAAFFNFVAAFLLGTAVAHTIGKGMIHIDSVTQYVVITGLFGAIVWDLLTWWWGLPTSSSHALIGGYAGAAIMRSGWHVIIIKGWYKTLIFIVVAPVMGLILGFTFMVAIFWLLRNRAPQKIDAWFRKLQLLSAAAYSLGHGGNDAQKTMGIVASALYGAHFITSAELAGDWGKFHWPIILAANTAIALGTYFGGWRIVHTMDHASPVETGGRVLCRICRSNHVICDSAGGNSSKYYTHHYGSYCRCRRDSSAIGGSLGRRQENCLGLGSYDSRVRAGCRRFILDSPVDSSRRLAMVPCRLSLPHPKTLL